ncbi:YscQ/HrcQ family type III secretion apparatus protein [Burkholderia ambifaria]|nr:YscQ/HrcQ family type III secretion apparatus protein [Burkholderia ambifaria]
MPQRDSMVTSLADSAGALQHFDAHTARLRRLLCDARLAALLAHTLDLTDWDVTDAAPAAWQTPGALELQHNGAAAAIAIDFACYPALASIATGAVMSDDPALDASLRNAVAAIVSQPLLDALNTVGLTDTQVTALRAATTSRTPLVLRFTMRGHRFECILDRVAPAWIDAIEQRIAPQCVPFSNCISQIGVPAWVDIGERALSVQTLNGLRAGDVVLRVAPASLRTLLDTPQQADCVDVYLGAPGARRFHVRASLDGTRLVITSDPQMTHETSRTEASLDGDDIPVAASIDELELPVRFEIETITLPLVQLSALRAGYVLELPRTLREARVRLLSYGQVIGTGELVAVGEHLGVRIVQMANGHDSVQ